MHWQRRSVDGAGISLEYNPAWPTLRGDRLVYQRFSGEGTISVRWGPDATIEDVLAHVGLGSAGATRVMEADHGTIVDGAPARRVQLRVISPAATIAGMPHPFPQDLERVYVFVGFEVEGMPVLVGYRAPASELAAFKTSLEHIVASVRLGKFTGPSTFGGTA